MKYLKHLLIVAVAIFAIAYLFPGMIKVDKVLTALWAAFILGIINVTIKPVLKIFTLPITILTLGLFTFVINALMLLLVAAVLPGFEVNGFIAALLGSILISLVSSVFSAILL